MSMSVGVLDHYNVSTRNLRDTVRFYADSGVIDHIAFGSRGFDAIKQHLTRKGVPFRVNEVPNSSRRQIFVTDPNNVLIELNFDVAKETAAR